MTELERARANLADAEASLAAGTNPYAKQNLASARQRLARLEAVAATSPTPAPPPPTPAAAAVDHAPAPVPAQPTGTREERLVRLADAWGADDATLGAAIDDGTTPDEFALICSHEALVKAKAREILSA